MKWQKLATDLLQEPAVNATVALYGDPGLGRLIRLLLLAGRTSRPEVIGRIVDGSGNPCRVEDVAISIGASEDELREFVSFLAVRGYVDPRLWRKDVIRFPHLEDSGDDYARKAQRKQARSEVSGHSPDSVRTMSGKIRSDQNRSDQRSDRRRRSVPRVRAGRPADANRPAAGMADTERPNPEAACTHEPACRTRQEHVRRYLEDERAARSGQPS